MTTQPEAQLEADLIAQLQGMKYARVKIKDQGAMLANLKQQLEIHNGNITLSKTEFDLILNHLNTGTVFNQATSELLAITPTIKILERKTTIDRVSKKIKLFIDTFIEGMGGTV